MKIRQGGQLMRANILIIRHIKSTSCSPYPSTLSERTEYIRESELENGLVFLGDVGSFGVTK